MLKLLKTIFKAGEATTQYPFAPAEVSPGFRGKPELDGLRCIACGACTMACPANALSMETDLEAGTRTWQLFLGRCIFCARCEEVCPTHALVLTSDFELSVANKEDLYQRATFKLQNCVECGKPFAPAKEVEYAMALLVQAGNAPEAVEASRAHYQTCPACKRKQNLNHPSQPEMGRYINQEVHK
jgi:formate hydrogenlyase subunit 6/NADH:ubiquinone oxidoreductase subunit I